jgi:signal recognition particle receptor subunit beta
MRTPEIMLTELNANLRRLRGACSVLENDDINKKLLSVVRRLLLAEVLNNTWILAIGGSQGAGKTTLMAYLYDCQQWLPANEGRGEKMPVLVVENKQITEPRGYIRRLEENKNKGVFEIKDIEVDVTEFNRAIRDPDAEELLPVLQVPSRYFKRDNQAWLLLPGYEKQDRANKSWQELMRQAMIAAGGSIVVTDETRLANQQQLEIVKDMLSNEFKHCKPYIVVSKTEKDHRNPEKIAQLEKSAKEVFDIGPDCADTNIILTGVDDNEYCEEWLPKLQSAIDELSFNGQSNRVFQLSQLSQLLSEDLAPVLLTIRSKSRLLFNQDDGTENIEEIIEAFDDSVEQLRIRHNQRVVELASNAFSKASTKLDDGLKKEHEGFKNWLASAFDTTSETKTKMQQLVQNSWRDATPAFFADYSKVLSSLTLGQLGKFEDEPDGSSQKKLADDKTIKLVEIGYLHSSGRPVRFKALTPEAVNDMAIFLGSNFQNADESQSTSKQLAKSMKLLPLIALEYSRLFYAMPALLEASADLKDSNTQPASNIVEDGVVSLQRGAELGRTAIKSFATVMAVDVLSDGDSDILGTILGQPSTEGADVPIPTPPVVMHPIAIAAAAVVAASYLTVKAVSGLRSLEKRVSDQAYSMLANVHDYHVEHLRKQFDETMRVTRERIYDVLRERYKLDEALMRKDRLFKAIADVTSIMDDLKYELDSSPADLQLFVADSRE